MAPYSRSQMEIQPFSAASAADWDRFVESSQEAWLYHLPSWMAIEAETTRSVAFAVRLDGRIVGICPMYVGRSRYAGVIGANTLNTGVARSGPALADGLTTECRHRVHQAMFDHLDELRLRHRIDRLLIRLPTLAPAYLPPRRPDVNPLTRSRPLSPIVYRSSLTSSHLVDKIVDLAVDVDRLWTGLESRCRTAIRKARAGGVNVREASSIEDVRVCHALHVQTLGRSGAPTPPLSRFERLWTAFHPTGHLRIFLAIHEGRSIGGLVTLLFKRAASPWAGGSDYAFQQFRPNNLLMWHAMNAARDSGCRWFEIGPVFSSNDQSSKMARIGRFKDQFGGDAYSLFEGSFDWRPAKMALLDLLDAQAGALVGSWRRAVRPRR